MWPQQITNFFNIASPIIGIIVIWELFWKSLGLWHAIQNKQRNWFVAIFIINTAGILPIIYLRFYQKKK